MLVNGFDVFGRHYKKIVIPTSLFLYHFFPIDRYFLPPKVTEIDGERIEFSFCKNIESNVMSERYVASPFKSYLKFSPR